MSPHPRVGVRACTQKRTRGALLDGCERVADANAARPLDFRVDPEKDGAVALAPAAVVREQAQRVEVALARLGITGRHGAPVDGPADADWPE